VCLEPVLLKPERDGVRAGPDVRAGERPSLDEPAAGVGAKEHRRRPCSAAQTRSREAGGILVEDDGHIGVLAHGDTGLQLLEVNDPVQEHLL
jgi:hypothetical protein